MGLGRLPKQICRRYSDWVRPHRAASYSSSLWVLLLFESIIATIGTAATLSWIGTGMLIQHIYSKHRQITNIILALALLECVFSILTV